MTQQIRVEVVFASRDSQQLLAVALPASSTVEDAIRESGIANRFPDEKVEDLPVGIWGHVVERHQSLLDGDRVEIYRPLDMDPRDARRQLALTGRTMGGESRE